MREGEVYSLKGQEEETWKNRGSEREKRVERERGTRMDTNSTNTE